MAVGKIDVHFHLVPQFFREAVHEVISKSPAGGIDFPDWSPTLALDVMDRQGIAVAIVSLAQPGSGFLPSEKCAGFARRCNDYAAELIAQHPRRFGCFGHLPMHDMDAAIAEARYCLETLRFEGISLFSSYGDKFLGDPWLDPLMSYLDSRSAVAHVHPALHPSTKSIALPWPGFMMEFVFDTTRAAVNLVFSGALERYPNIRFILSHGGGTMPYIAWRLSVSPMIDPRLKQRSPQEILAGLKTFWYDSALVPAPQARYRASQRRSASSSAATGRSAMSVWWPKRSGP
jgi:6-methylsalicylate decarboxylase